MRRLIRPCLLSSILLLATLTIVPSPVAAQCISTEPDQFGAIACVFEESWNDCERTSIGAWADADDSLSVHTNAGVQDCESYTEICAGMHEPFSAGDCQEIPALPELCSPGLPCLTFTAGLVAQPLSTTANGDPLATVGGVTITFTTGHFATIVLAAEGDSAPCSTVAGLPGVADCVANPIVPNQTYFEPALTGENPTACLKNAWLGVDVDGDGNDETGGPAFIVETGVSNCTS